VIVAATAAPGCGATAGPGATRGEIEAKLERIARQTEEPIYYLGRSFSGLPLTHAAASRHGALFVYGECRPRRSGERVHCTGPQVQLQQTLIASPERYDTPWRGCVRTTVRGVPAGQFDGFEVYTGEALVTIYARDFDEAKRAAAALRPVGRRTSSGAPLPPPTIDVERALRECALESLDAKLAELRREKAGPLYWVGREFEGHPLRVAEGDGSWARFLYGACVRLAAGHAACWPPLTIEVTRAGEFRPAGWHPSIRCTSFRTRGASTALMLDSHGLVLFTGEIAVRLGGEDVALFRRAAEALRELDQEAAPAALPPAEASIEAQLRRTCAR
jgi:predicted alpha/beta hydrolase